MPQVLREFSDAQVPELALVVVVAAEWFAEQLKVCAHVLELLLVHGAEASFVGH